MTHKDDVFILTLDGPSGSGKGTLGQMIARLYNWHYLDSGGLYRAFAYAADRKDIESHDEIALRQLIGQISITFIATQDGGSGIEIDGENVTQSVRSEEVGKLASKYATVKSVREMLLSLQKQAAKPPGLVADGRDMGSVVFPQADLKFFLTASENSRVLRRYKQLKPKKFDVNLPRLVEDIRHRDYQDANRGCSPMVPAHDAMVIDTTSMSIEDVCRKIVQQIDRKVAAAPL